LPNGLRVLVAPSDVCPLVSVELLLDASACDERFPTREEERPWVRVPGIRKVLLTGMLQGSVARDGATLRRLVADAGGVLEGRVQPDVMELSVTVPRDALAVGLQALAEIVCRPQLSDADLTTAIARALDELRQAPDGILALADAQSRKTLYVNHPYADAGPGDARLLRLWTPDLVKFLYPYFVRPNAAVLAIVGACKSEDAQALVERAFGDWRAQRNPWSREEAAIPALAQSRLALAEAPVRAHGVMLSFPVCGVDAADYPVLRVIDALLGGGTGARLFRGAREEQHLAYEVSSLLTAQRLANTLSLYAVIDDAHVDAAKDALAHEAQRLQAEPVTVDELARAKAYLLGREQLARQDNARQAFTLAWNSLCGLGMDYPRTAAVAINAITADDVQRVAARYFTHYVLVVVTPNVVRQE
jgi:zinc protease